VIYTPHHIKGNAHALWYNCTKMAAVPELLNAGDWQDALSDVDAVLFDCDGY